MMAIFMPTDFKNLSINNLIKLQYPSHILTNESLLKPYFNIGVGESSSSCMSNVVGSSNLPIMSELSDQNNLKTRLCSEDDSNSNDSELSVGQEKVVHNEQSGSKNNIKNNSNNNNNNNNSKESIDSDDDDEEMSNASSSQYTTSSTRLCSPQQSTREIGDMMRPIQFHEEILRSSQLYAEEILRQRIAAAARLQSATDTKSHNNNNGLDEPEPSIISKLGFQTGLFSSTKLTAADNGSNENGNNIFSAKSAINFQNIHSHLSAISQITHSLGSNMKKDDTTSLSSLSRESSQSPSGFQQFNKQQHHHHNLHHHHHHHHHNHHHATHQNQLHEHNLKFSIDNILKADFGRRITEPLLKTSRLKRSSKHHQQQQQQQHQHEKEKINNSFTTVDTLQKEPHNSSVTKDKSIDQTFSSSTETSSKSDAGGTSTSPGGTVWPAWVFCTRYSDRPSSGRSPRVKKPKKPPSEVAPKDDEKRPRTAFSGAQLARLKHEFNENRYLTEKRRQQLSGELGLNEAQIKIWFQNKRAKIKKSSGVKNPLALQLMAQGLYNHSTVPLSKEEEELQELQSGN